MKKIITIAALAAISTGAFATDVTVSTGRNFGSDTNAATVAVGKQFGAVRGEASLGRVTNDGREANVLGLGVSYPVATVGGVTVAAKAGANYFAGQGPAANGYALRGGVEATYPLTKTVSLVANVERVEAQRRIEAIEGNVVTFGLRSSF